MAKNDDIDGPKEIYGYDGKIHLERASASDWRKHRQQRAREKGTHTKSQWIELRDRIGHCVHCGDANAFLCKDHILPISRGGCDCIENIQPLCHSCNSRKSSSVEGVVP